MLSVDIYSQVALNRQLILPENFHWLLLTKSEHNLSKIEIIKNFLKIRKLLQPKLYNQEKDFLKITKIN